MFAVAVLLLLNYFYVDTNQGSFPHSNTTEPLVASVSDRLITVSELKAYLDRRGESLAGGFSESQVASLLDELVAQQLQYVYARKMGYANDPAIRATVERMMVARLREEQLSPLLDAVVVADDEVVSYYQQHQTDYLIPPMFRAAIIHFSLHPQATDAKRAEIHALAQDVLAQAQNLPPSSHGFGALAARHSEDQASRYVGGDIGWLEQGRPSTRLPPAAIDALDGLDRPGSLAPLFEADDGLYLLMLLDRKPAQQQTLEGVRHGIQRSLLQEKRARVEREWLASLHSEADVQIYTEVLKAVQQQSGAVQEREAPRPPSLPPG